MADDATPLDDMLVEQTGTPPEEYRDPHRKAKIRGLIVGTLVGALVACGFGVIAAITVNVTNDAISGDDTIAECTAAASVTLGTSTYDPSDGRYEYADVSYSGVAACAGDRIKITAINASNTVQGTATGVIANDGDDSLSWDTPPPVSNSTEVVVSIQDL